MKTRRYITQGEWNTLMQAIPDTEETVRDRCLLIMMYIHGLRVSELANIQISSISLESNEIYIRRIKNGFSTTHPIQDEEKVWLLRWLNIRQEKLGEKTSPWLYYFRQKRKNIASAGLYAGQGVRRNGEFARQTASPCTAAFLWLCAG